MQGQALLTTLVASLPDSTKPRRHFITHIIMYMVPMATIETHYHNRLLLDRFFAILPKDTELTKNDPQVRQSYNFICIAA